MIGDKQYKGIVLDDPVISLDVMSYHNIKNFLIAPNNLINKASRLIILTHNIYYLYVQASNLFDSKTHSVSLFEIYPNKIKEVDLNILKTDDITLFVKVVNEIKEVSDISKVYWLSLKISRYFLDLRLRMNGVLPIDNKKDQIKSEVEQLGLEKDLTKEIHKNLSYIMKICRKNNVIVRDIIELFTRLNTIILQLGFEPIIRSKVFERLSYFDQNEKITYTDKRNNIREEILYQTKKLIDEDKFGMKQYIEHPRHQLTQSLFAINISDN